MDDLEERLLEVVLRIAGERHQKQSKKVGMRNRTKCVDCGKAAVAQIKVIHPAVSNQADPVCRRCLDWWLEWYGRLPCGRAGLEVERYAQATARARA